jgi:hypothetical protein
MSTPCNLMKNEFLDRMEYIPVSYVESVSRTYSSMVNAQSILAQLGMDTTEFAKQIAQLKNFLAHAK